MFCQLAGGAIHPDCMILQSKWRIAIETEVFTLVFKRTFLHLNRHWIGPISYFWDRKSALPILGWIGHHYLK